MREPLFDQWVVYDHPKDFPDSFVARRHAHDPDVADYFPTEDYMASRDLKALRQALARKGLVRLDRDPSDPPQIMEIWL